MVTPIQVIFAVLGGLVFAQLIIHSKRVRVGVIVLISYLMIMSILFPQTPTFIK